MHKIIEPAILYFGTPVVLITTVNEDGTTNVAPNSAVFWLGWSCMVGLDASSKTTENILRTKECVINLASFDLAEEVNSISLLTGSEHVPLHKKLLGYTFSKDKLANSRLTLIPSNEVASQRIEQCQIQLESVMANAHRFAEFDTKMGVPALAIEFQVKVIHASESVLYESDENKIDPLKWNPLIACFRRFFGLSEIERTSKLFTGNEDLYAPWRMRGIIGMLTRFGLSVSIRNSKKQLTSRSTRTT